jgi:transcriptional regulator with XRE-family HTH domain
MGRDAEVASDLGRRLRAARLKRGATQRMMATLAGVSPATWSRLEVGAGGSVPLRTWILAADALGLDLIAPEVIRPPFDRSIRRLLEPGGWRPGRRIGDVRWYDRAPRRQRGLRTLLPAERVAVRVVPVLVDGPQEWSTLRAVVEASRRAAPEDTAIGGVLVVVDTSANRRLARDPRRRSDVPWLRALRDPGVAMPARLGWVWLAPRGTHLLPAG